MVLQNSINRRTSDARLDAIANATTPTATRNIQIDNTGAIVLGEGVSYNSTTRATTIAIGTGSGTANTTGTSWLAIGVNAGLSNTSASTWTAIGVDAARSSTTGTAWTAVGVEAARSSTTGTGWTAVGGNAARNNTTGNWWTAVGYDAGRSNSSGGAWTAIGANAGNGNAGSNWTAVGQDAGRNTTGLSSNWTALGFESGLVAGTGSVYLGYRAGRASSRANTLHIANNETESLIYGEFDTKLIRINGSLSLSSGASITALLTATKTISAPSTTDTITVTGAQLGDHVLVSRGANAFVSAADTVQFDSTGLNSVVVRATVLRIS